MNDTSLKSVESPKSPGEVEAATNVEATVDNEVDPLALDDGESGKLKEVSAPLPKEVIVEKAEEKSGTCDDNAKEKSSSENLNESCDNFVNVNAVQSENVKDILNEETTAVAADQTAPEPSQAIDDAVESKTVSNSEVEQKSPKDDIVETSTAKNDTGAPKSDSESKKPEKERVAEVAVPVVAPVASVEKKAETKIEKPKSHSMNGDMNNKDDHAIKRRASDDVDAESPLKKLCGEVERNFPHHDSMINEYIQTATRNNVDEIQRHTEQLLSEIHTLRELAQKKEHEWNNILHLKKVKEEILLRLLRRKQVISFEKADTTGPDRTDPFEYLNQPKNLAIDKSDEFSGLSLKQPGTSLMNPMIQPTLMPSTSHYNPMSGLPPPYDKPPHMQSMPKPVFPPAMMMPGHLQGFPRDMNGQLSSYGLPMGRQGPTKDVKSIIADYRQRNPEITPRRGRRMKSILNPNIMNPPRAIAPKVDGMNNLNAINMVFNSLDMHNQKAALERLQQMQGVGIPNGLSFKDVLIQFANMQQTNAGLIPTRPPETITSRPEHHVRPEGRRRQQDRLPHEEAHISAKQAERLASSSPRLPPPPPYPEISLLPVSSTTQDTSQQNSLLHGILTKQGTPATQSYSPTLAKLLMSPEKKPSGSKFGQAKNCGEITITPVQPTPPPQETTVEKPEEVVQLDDEESPASEGEASGSPSGSGSGRLVIDEGGAGEGGEGVAGEGGEDTPLCQGCRKRDAQFVCAGCANQWYCSRECQVAAWDDHSDMCTG